MSLERKRADAGDTKRAGEGSGSEAPRYIAELKEAELVAKQLNALKIGTNLLPMSRNAVFPIKWKAEAVAYKTIEEKVGSEIKRTQVPVDFEFRACFKNHRYLKTSYTLEDHLRDIVPKRLAKTVNKVTGDDINKAFKEAMEKEFKEKLGFEIKLELQVGGSHDRVCVSKMDLSRLKNLLKEQHKKIDPEIGKGRKVDPEMEIEKDIEDELKGGKQSGP